MQSHADFILNIPLGVSFQTTTSEKELAICEKAFGSQTDDGTLIALKKSQARLAQALAIEEDFWRQKSTCKWLQELTHSIDTKCKDGKLLLKLDMAKAYDWIQWCFLYAMLRQIGFSERWIHLVSHY